MKHKLRLVAAGLACSVLAYFVLTRGLRRMPGAEPAPKPMTVVVDLPKTNTAGAAPMNAR